MYNPIPDHQYVHGAYSPITNNSDSDALIANVKNVHTNESQLHIIRNPAFQFWVTKPALRTYTNKRECVPLTDVDMYIGKYSNMVEEIGRALGHSFSFTNKRKFLSSPYVYGADIDPLVRMKLEYKQSCDTPLSYFKVGALDIETSVLGDNQIILISYADFHTRTVYCGVLNSWVKTTEDELQARTAKEYKEFSESLNSAASTIWNQQPFKVVYGLFEKERDLLIWTFKNIHICKPDFCGVWNIAFDIPYIIERAIFRGLKPEHLFCHPDVPKQYRYITFREDKSQTHSAHFTDKWHVVECPGYTRWYDPMCLYARLRRVDSKLPFYTLDFVGNKIIGSGKMQFGINATHYSMQTNDMVGYCVYNTLDAVIPALCNAVTDDVTSMVTLTGCGLISTFASQTVQIKAFFFEYCMSHGLVPGTVYGSQVEDTDVYIGNIGGAVLNPQLMRAKGARCIKEADIATNIYKLCCDIDFTSQYPSILISSNISKETKLATLLWLSNSPFALDQVLETKDVKDEKGKLNPRARANAEHMFNFLCQYMATKENAVALCEAFNLPGYTEMLNIWDNRP